VTRPINKFGAGPTLSIQQARNLAPPPNLQRAKAAPASARQRRRRRGQWREEEHAEVPVQGGGGVLPSGPAEGGGSGAPRAVQRPQGQGLQPGLLGRAPPPPVPSSVHGPQVAADSPASEGPRDLLHRS
jgi:hypothetical protein